jgi:plasmid stability protein
MKAITLRNIPPNLSRRIERRAKEKGASMNRTVIQILEDSLGTSNKRAAQLHHDLDHLAGSWSEVEATDFDEDLAAQRGIDPELWR